MNKSIEMIGWKLLRHLTHTDLPSIDFGPDEGSGASLRVE